ncbi:WecB/TagA/CpsF family glycosyltransferase [Microbacterium sp. zg-Y818]|uniref:WecB/TagA/CpsF family glycosyltransferase n=1 Tax=unclassified Microbacterium TaxID=2609290 RepID=UPI00214C138C|nr:MULTISPECIES: WecB/TagA/CpsF family glycosyltransferase [unclassified Microbacterium]MCR2801914.1 WecB/TagA/CpsF family glycosyltransferase [Microbacterium sp. zg.Y818]WIM22829.1 WecB/TagA/CpsF family glycosyltransferase [Microbacterium sp. zg-Y818]
MREFGGLLSNHKGLIRSDEEFDSLALGHRWRVQTVNLHHLALAKRDARFKSSILEADWITADGWPVVSFLRAHGRNVERVTGSAWLLRALNDGRMKRLRVGLLGGSAGAGDGLQRFGLDLIWRDHRDKADWTSAGIAESLNAARVEVLLVAVTPPHGDLIGADISAAGFNGSIIAVGGGVDMAVGIQRRSPQLIQDLHLEWFFRFVNAPRRLGKRYFVHCLPFFVTDLVPVILRAKCRRNLTGGLGRP